MEDVAAPHTYSLACMPLMVAAIVNAVVDALAPLGVKDLDMPATSERIWQAMRAARA